MVNAKIMGSLMVIREQFLIYIGHEIRAFFSQHLQICI